MRKARLKISLNVTVLIGLVLVYALGVATMWAIPHRVNGFGRMNAHQLFASLGRAATFGTVDRTLVDWYMMGPTLEENTAQYDRVVLQLTLALTGPFILWCFLIAFILGTWRSTRAKAPSAFQTGVEPSAAQHGGPGTPFGNSGVTEGPPSVS